MRRFAELVSIFCIICIGSIIFTSNLDAIEIVQGKYIRFSEYLSGKTGPRKYAKVSLYLDVPKSEAKFPNLVFDPVVSAIFSTFNYSMIENLSIDALLNNKFRFKDETKIFQSMPREYGERKVLLILYKALKADRIFSFKKFYSKLIKLDKAKAGLKKAEIIRELKISLDEIKSEYERLCRCLLKIELPIEKVSHNDYNVDHEVLRLWLDKRMCNVPLKPDEAAKLFENKNLSAKVTDFVKPIKLRIQYVRTLRGTTYFDAVNSIYNANEYILEIISGEKELMKFKIGFKKPSKPGKRGDYYYKRIEPDSGQKGI